MTTTTTAVSSRIGTYRSWAPLGVGAAVYLFLLITGNNMLQDSDLFWQIDVGQRIIDTGTVPIVDHYSLTMRGAPWMSSSWLAQVLLAASFALAGWAGSPETKEL